jgi:hypothetical protein
MKGDEMKHTIAIIDKIEQAVLGVPNTKQEAVKQANDIAEYVQTLREMIEHHHRTEKDFQTISKADIPQIEGWAEKAALVLEKLSTLLGEALKFSEQLKAIAFRYGDEGIQKWKETTADLARSAMEHDMHLMQRNLVALREVEIHQREQLRQVVTCQEHLDEIFQ